MYIYMIVAYIIDYAVIILSLCHETPISNLQFLLLVSSLGISQVISTSSLFATNSAAMLYSDTSGVSLMKVRFSGAGK